MLNGLWSMLVKLTRRVRELDYPTERGKRVLVIEQEKAAMDQACALLNDAGCEVLQVERVEEAFQCIAKNQPDCVLVDMAAPEADLLVSQVRNHRYLRFIPLVAISEGLSPLSEQHALELGCVGSLRLSRRTFALNLFDFMRTSTDRSFA